MPCKLCLDVRPCEMTVKQIKHYIKHDNKSSSKEVENNSLKVSMNMHNSCPCKECIVNSTCSNGILCKEFRETAFDGVTSDLKNQISGLVISQMVERRRYAKTADR